MVRTDLKALTRARIGILGGIGLLFAGAALGWFGGIWGPVVSVHHWELVAAQLAAEEAARERAEREATARRPVATLFTTLDRQTVRLPATGRPGYGGGVTSWGTDLLVIQHDGGLVRVGSDLAAERLEITPPENGYEAYVARSREPPFDQVEHNFSWFRYNDIHAFSGESGSGLLVSYTEYDPGQACYTNSLARLDVAPGTPIGEIAAEPGDWRVLFRTAPCLPLKTQWRAIEGHMAGGRLEVVGETAYISAGTYHWDGMFGPRTVPGTDPESGPPVAQDPRSDYGKVLAVDLATGVARQVSRGHRNMQGIAADADGRIWTVEHGMRGGDELNRIVEGGDYGWPYAALGVAYSGLPLPTGGPLGRHVEGLPPVLAWLPSIAPAAIEVLDGFHEAWDGDLLIGTLSSEQLVRVRVAGERALFAEYIPVGERVRHIHRHSDGRIALLTDTNALVLLEAVEGGLEIDFLERRIAALDGDDTFRERVRTALFSCMECHSMTDGQHAGAPSLGKVHGAEIGATSFGGYSEAMLGAGGRWDTSRLAAFLADPQAVVPGTAMPDPNVSDAEVREAVVWLLERLAHDQI